MAENMPEMMTSIHRFEKPNTSQLQEMSHYSKTSQHQRQRDGVKEAREKRKISFNRATD